MIAAGNAADHLLRHWARKRINVQGPDLGAADLGASYTLSADITLPSGAVSRTVKIWFCEVTGHPDLMRIGSQNWRCEHEVSGYVKREVARELYRAALGVGMVRS